MKQRRRRLLSVLLLAAVTAAVATGATVWLQLSRSIDLSTSDSAQIRRGSSVVAAVNAIDTQCPLPTPKLVSVAARLIARISGSTVQRGWYRFKAGDTQFDVLMALFGSHRRPTIRVTIPEGRTYAEIAGILARTIEADSAAFVDWCERDSVCRSYGVDGPTMEGYLMPDTYAFYWRDEVPIIGDRLASEFRRRWQQHCDGLLAKGLRTKHEIISLASIVQAEAANVDEMPRIAGVYQNRLDRNMRLEADPTVQYGRGARQRVLYKHLDDDSPYNTYRRSGLPPGPICNPGIHALMAALQPEDHAYMFFVARGDGSGLHYFATDGAGHVANVRRYRATRR
ncbi:MAG: endolytic transglycosylase MltG [Candidatus Kapabacteria bacterium]|nr:endolytic transglycosylase MltG [Candidatus Kapabacteria bacterium]